MQNKAENKQTAYLDHKAFLPFLEDLKQFISGLEAVRGLGLNLDKAHLSPGALKGDFYPADVTYKAVVHDRNGHPAAFLLCANPVGSNLVAENIDKALKSAARLGPGLNHVIDAPLCHGWFEGISWGLYRYNHPLATGKIGWALQRSVLGPAVLKWITGVVEKTWKRVPEKKMAHLLIEPLQILSRDTGFSGEIRRAAGDALNAASTGKWRPCLTLSHNDLWKGNVMLSTGTFSRERLALYSHPPILTGAKPLGHDCVSAYGKKGAQSNIGKSVGFDFKIIDWAGASIDGIPFFDLMKCCQSFHVPARSTRKLIRTHCEILNASPDHAALYLVSALALLGRHLDQFPRHAYLRLGHELFYLMKASTG